jgi:hypothetical protein
MTWVTTIAVDLFNLQDSSHVGWDPLHLAPLYALKQSRNWMWCIVHSQVLWNRSIGFTSGISGFNSLHLNLEFLCLLPISFSYSGCKLNMAIFGVEFSLSVDLLQAPHKYHSNLADGMTQPHVFCALTDPNRQPTQMVWQLY